MTERQPPETPPPDPSTDDRAETPASATPNRGGAPKGNVNAATDPEFTIAMRNAQRLARRNRTRRHASHLAAAREIVRECGLEGSPLAETVARRVGQVEAEIEELGIVVERVGRTKRDGTLNPSYERRLLLIGQDRQELRQLLDRLIELRETNPGDAPRTDTRFMLPGTDAAAVTPTCPSCGTELWHELSMAATGNAGARDTGTAIVPGAHGPLVPGVPGFYEKAIGRGEGASESFGADPPESESTEPTPDKN